MVLLLLAVAVVVALAVVLYAARSAWRRSVRRELCDLLREGHPEVAIVSESQASLELKTPDGGSGTLYLGNLYAGLAAGPSDPEARREAIRSFLESALSQRAEASQPLRLDVHGDRLLPRLQPEGFLAQAGAEDTLLQVPSGISGLVTVFVLDSEQSVMYLTLSRLAELGIDTAALAERALANLRRKTPDSPVRDAVERGHVVMLKAGDSFDATRLLLVPEMLRDGEQLAAVIPDRETLGLLPVPPDGDWSGIRKLARAPASPYTLLDRPLRVTNAGFEIA